MAFYFLRYFRHSPRPRCRSHIPHRPDHGKPPYQAENRPEKGRKRTAPAEPGRLQTSLYLFFFTHSDRTMNGSRRKNRTTYTGFTSLHPAGLTALKQLSNASRRSVLIREAVNFNGVSAVSAGVCEVVISEIMGPDVPAVAFVRDLPTATAQPCGKCLVIGHIYAPFLSAV